MGIHMTALVRVPGTFKYPNMECQINTLFQV